MLRLRSPVFKAMLIHDMQEKRSNRIKIMGFEVNVVEEFLRYIHTDELSFYGTYTMELCKIADYYGVESLKVRGVC